MTEPFDIGGFDMDKECAKLGIEAEGFLRSAFGRYFMERCQLDEVQLMAELRKCDSDDVKENTRIRNKLDVIELIRLYVSETVKSGRNAKANLELRDVIEKDDVDYDAA